MKKRVILTVSLILTLSFIVKMEVYGTSDEGFGIQLELDQETLDSLDRQEYYIDKRYDGPRKIVYGQQENFDGSYTEGYFDVTCNYCGYENAQWITEDSVAYCSYCGNFAGMPTYLGKTLPEDSGSGTDNNSSDDMNYPTYEGEEDDDIPITVVVGGAAIVGAAVTKLIKVGSKKKKDKVRKPSRKKQKVDKEYKEDNEDEEVAGFIINLSQDQIVLSEGLSSQVNIKVLRVNKDGTAALESSAPILIKQSHNSALKIKPKNGLGELNIVIEEKKNGNLQEETIEITTSLRGREKNAKIEVRSENDMKVVFF